MTSSTTTITIGTTAAIVTANYRLLEYHNLTLITNSGTTVSARERHEWVTINANPPPSNYTFNSWTGDTSGFEINKVSTSAKMGTSDRTITATYREISAHTLTVHQLSGDVIYTQNEFTTVSLTAENAPAGKRFVQWNITGQGNLSTRYSSTTVFTFGNGNTELTPIYVNVWTITVTDGTVDGSSSILLNEGSSYRLMCRRLAAYERFDGWMLAGPGIITNLAATDTYFTVGNGDATITASISNYPDKTLTIYMRDPDTETDTLLSEETYTYGSAIPVVAPVAPDKTTFSTWLGDVEVLYPSALASSVSINNLTTDATIVATYYYPESPQYFTLNVYDGYPATGVYAVGSQISIRAREPSQGWEFYKWYGDTQYLVNQDLTISENLVVMPLKSIELYAKFKVAGETPLYRISVTNGIASGTYEDSSEVEHTESGAYIDVPAGTIVTLTADPDVVGWVFDYWSGNFASAGVDDIIVTDNPATFTAVESDLNIVMTRRELDKYTVYTTNATGPGTNYPGTYPIAGNLSNTEERHYVFNEWSCVDANEEDCISAIGNPNLVETTITLTDKDLWATASYTTYYKLTVVQGQDSGGGYYYEGQTVNSVVADTPTPGSRLIFDHWDDPTEIITNIYDPTPTIVMKDTVATITAVYVSLDARGNSVVVTGSDLHTGVITKTRSTLINGVYAVGTIVFDADGCIGVITSVDPDQNDNTDDYGVTKLFYGGNF